MSRSGRLCAPSAMPTGSSDPVGPPNAGRPAARTAGTLCLQGVAANDTRVFDGRSTDPGASSDSPYRSDQFVGMTGLTMTALARIWAWRCAGIGGVAIGAAHLLRTDWRVVMADNVYSFRGWLWDQPAAQAEADVSATYWSCLGIGVGLLLLGVFLWSYLGRRRHLWACSLRLLPSSAGRGIGIRGLASPTLRMENRSCGHGRRARHGRRVDRRRQCWAESGWG